jgi:hypothetical protein
MSKRLAFVVAVVLALAAPPAAGATTIGRGFGPAVAVDLAGTAYIAWPGPENPASLQFCRLPRGATTCDIRHAITAPGTTSSRAFVALSPASPDRVSVVQYRYPLAGPEPAGMYEFISTNGGADFGAGRRVASIPFFDAVVGETTNSGITTYTMSGVTDADSGGGLFARFQLGASGAASGSAQLFGLDHPYRGAVGLVDYQTPLVVFTAGNDAAQLRRYGGSGDPNDAANWTPAVDLGVAAYPKLASRPYASGTGGLYLLASAADKAVFVAPWNGTTFGPRETIARGADAPTLDAFEDGAGRLHVVYARGDAAGLNLIYASSGVIYTAPRDRKPWTTSTVTTQSPPVGIAETQVAVDLRGSFSIQPRGVVVYRAGNPMGEIRVEPVPPPPPPAATLPPKNKPPAKAHAIPSGRVNVTIKGALGLPPDVDPAHACNGKLAATLKRGTKTIAKRALKLSSACKYRNKLTLKPAKVKKAKKLKLALRFPGNASVGPVTASYRVAIN